MRVSIVKAWIKAVGVACVVELLCVIPLAMAIARGQPANGKFVDGFLNFLSLYHMFAITLAFSVLNIIWAWHGPANCYVKQPALRPHLRVPTYPHDPDHIWRDKVACPRTHS